LGALAEIKQQERDTRRRLILTAAQELFAEKDFRSVTVRQIANVAGVSVGTIYNHYANLDELFVDVFIQGARGFARLLDTERLEGRRPSLSRLCEMYVSYLNDNMTFYQMMSHFMLGGKLTAEATERLNLVMRDLMDSVEFVIRESGVEKDTRLTAQALFSALNGIMISYASYPGRSLEEIRRHTAKLAALMAEVFMKQAAR
jgi:AcrR family transcriptional regulator